jgi:hypothetical protein
MPSEYTEAGPEALTGATMWDNPKRVEAAIKHFAREIEEIDRFVYKSNEHDDRVLYAGMLERKRDDMVRCAVLQLHTAIEDVLDQLLIFKLTGATRRHRRRGQTASAVRSMLVGGGSVGFDRKLVLALALRIITPRARDRLQVLNGLRNKCSHNWILKAPVRHGKRPGEKKPPLLRYEGRDLHTVAALEDFVREFGDIYVKLWAKSLDFD